MGSKETLTAIRKQRAAVQKAILARQQAQDDEKQAKAELKRLTDVALREIEAENQDAIDNPTPAEKPEANAWAA